MPQVFLPEQMGLREVTLLAIKFTPEELAEMAAYDALVDADDTLTPEEWESSMRRDLKAGAKFWSTETRKAYYRSHRADFDRRKKASLASLAKRYGKFGGMIRAERKRLGKKVPELAEAYGTSVRSWYMIERGEVVIRWEAVRRVLPGIGPRPADFPKEVR